MHRDVRRCLGSTDDEGGAVMSTATFSTTDAMVNQTPAHLVTIGQVQTRITTITTSHGVDQGMGSCTIRTPALYSWIVVGASVTVQLGYAETGTHPAFKGTVVQTTRVFSGDSGWEYDVSCDGQLARMVDGEEEDIQFPEIYLGNLARSLADMRGVEPLIVDRIKSPVDWALDKNWIFLGGNEFVDEGMVPIQKRSGFYNWLRQKLQMFGYRFFERPAWDARVGRISGAPTKAKHSAIEGVNIFRGDRRRVNDQINYWEVEGSRYTDNDGIGIKFRSIPASVPFDNRLRPKGFRTGKVADSILSSQFLVDTVRQAHEIDYTEPSDWTSFELPGDSLIQPGDTIGVTSEILGHTSEVLWVMSVRHQYSDQGFWTTIEAWAGHGTMLESGNDEVVVPVVTGPVHVGDEHVAWYAVPNPSGTAVSFDITIPDDYTAIYLEWWSHGCNSYFLDGASNESTVSKIIVVQAGEEVGSAELPMQPEEYERQLPYGNGFTHWGFNRMPIPGKLKAGSATVTLKSGEDNRLPWATRWDDFEVQQVVMKLTGVGQPILPKPRG